MKKSKILTTLSLFFTGFGAVYFVLSLFHQGFGMEAGLLAMILGELIDVPKYK